MKNAPLAMQAGAAYFILFYFSHFGMATDSVSMTCKGLQAYLPPEEWLEHHESTPSDIYDLKAQLYMSEETQLPVLNITWLLSPDGSIQKLKATVICIQNTERFCFQCNYNATFKSPWNPQKQLWQFHYTDYPVDPATSYTVTAFNIPTSNINEYAPETSANIETPGCDHDTMKNHAKCEDVLWKPNISACLVNNDVVINFTTSATSSMYYVDLSRCNVPSSPNLNETTIFQIEPYFYECHYFCKRHQVVLQHCKRDEGTIATPSTEALVFEDKLSFGYFIIIGLCAILSVLGVGLFLKNKLSKANERNSPTNDTEPLQPVKVLIIYSVDNELFQNVILAFADFLHSFNGIQVIIDVWQRRNIAEMGPAQWLASQKEKADKIIIVTSKSAKMKWDAIYYKTSIDQKLSFSEDMYSIALNLFCSDMQNYSHLHKYCIVYFDTICSAKDIPSIYSPCVKYCLGKDINKLFKNLRNSSHKVHSKYSTLGPYSNYNILFNHKMKNVILKLKDWQNIQPTSNILVKAVEDFELQSAENLQIDVETPCP
ncbi:interleukin-17 receptor B isoform X2 [Pristis pectinata]|uniref:interleukin-17 receptor B isoform X2 n=1 Tax=Pristis pectinata TaxID=685728 RepID=UPI00223D4931|nr:interleukin-17 receptor B isoform X2 [Pristis pectinata]